MPVQGTLRQQYSRLSQCCVRQIGGFIGNQTTFARIRGKKRPCYGPRAGQEKKKAVQAALLLPLLQKTSVLGKRFDPS